MARASEQLTRFGTDIVGLERFLRLVQSICHILCVSPALLGAFLPRSNSTSPHASVHKTEVDVASALALVSLSATILHLRNQVNIVRRTMRLFRFLDSFSRATARLSSPTLDAEAFLDVTSLTLLGIYGLLETATLPDVLGVPGLRAWGAERSAAMNVEAQRCWFLALAFGFAAGAMRVLGSLAHAPAPPTAAGFGLHVADVSDEKRTDAEKEREREELRNMWEAERAAEKTMRARIGRKMAADGLDMLLPAAALGWVPGVEQWAVGTAMLVTTLMTGSDAWERCGRELDAKRES